MTLSDSPLARFHGSCGPTPQAYSGQLTHGTPLPSCLDSSHIPPGHPTSLSRCPPLAVQLPHHSDRAPCTQRKRIPQPARHMGRHYTSPARYIPASLSRARRGHVTLGSTAHGPPNQRQLWTCQGCTKPPATLGARQWQHSQMLPGGAGASRNHAATSTRHGKHLGVFASPSPSSKGTQRNEPAQVGGWSTPNPPCCSPFGDANGVRNP